MNALQGSMSGQGHHQHVQQGLASGAGANAVAGNAGAGVGGASLMPAALQHQHSASAQPYSSIVCQDDGGGGQQQHHHHVLLHHHSPIPGVSPPGAARAAAAATAGGGAGGSSTSNGNSNPPSRYESQKRRDWNTFGQYLKNHRPPLALSRCSGAHVLEFLRYLDQFGKTKVHAPGCPFFGHPHPPAPCACPLQQAWGSLDALIGRLRAAFEEHGGKPESNPFGARAVRLYLREVREMQAKARGIAYEKKKRKRPPQPQQPFLQPQQQQQQQHQQPHHMQQQQHFEQGGPLGPLTPSSSASRHAAASNSADHHLLLLHQQQHPHLLHQHQQQTLQHHHVQPQEQPVNNITGPSSLLLPRCN